MEPEPRDEQEDPETLELLKDLNKVAQMEELIAVEKKRLREMQEDPSRRHKAATCWNSELYT